MLPAIRSGRRHHLDIPRKESEAAQALAQRDLRRNSRHWTRRKHRPSRLLGMGHCREAKNNGRTSMPHIRLLLPGDRRRPMPYVSLRPAPGRQSYASNRQYTAITYGFPITSTVGFTGRAAGAPINCSWNRPRNPTVSPSPRPERFRLTAWPNNAELAWRESEARMRSPSNARWRQPSSAAPKRVTVCYSCWDMAAH